ncbi:MAG: prephenate dehydrogenase/arogenate dehydrogenase family protein [Actinomycetota bacterium]
MARGRPGRTVAVIGTGLMGGSLGLACLARGAAEEVIGYDSDPQRLDEAIGRGAITRAAPSLAEAGEGADLVIVATPVSSIPEVFDALVPELPEGVIVTDVGSVKSSLVREIERRSPDRIRFVGGHPLAGSEEEGIEAAAADLFEGCVWFLTPTDRSEAEACRELVRFASELGARAVFIDPERHDELVALTSHLPQVVSSALMHFAAAAATAEGGVPLIASGGFRDMTRLAGSSPELWVQILRENRDGVLKVLGGFAQSLESITAAMRSGEWEAIRAVLAEARGARSSMPGKPGLEVQTLVEIRVPVPDRPGVIAEVTTALGEAAVNIEDFEIRHSPAGGRGEIRLWVQGADAAELAEKALRSAGFASRRAG